MFDIVTAKQGKPHVTAEQQARINASAFGPGRYILDVGDGLALSMADANTLTIGSGAIMADGRVIDNEEAVSVAIANGSQAAYRRDLVVYSIETDASTGITTGELSVLQGATATTESAAKDPTYTAGNLLDGDLKAVVPIARVKLAALTPTVEPLLSKVPNIASLRDSVSRKPETFINGGRSIKFTPSANCLVIVFAFESNQWGYDGGTFSSSIGSISGLTRIGGIEGKASGGNTVGRQLVSVACFKNAKKGTAYTASYTLNGGGNGNTASSAMMVVCLPS